MLVFFIFCFFHIIFAVYNINKRTQAMLLDVYVEFFVKAIFPPMILLLGLVGNVLLFLVLSRKKFSSFPVRNIFRFLAISDSIYLLQFIEDYLAHMFDYDVRNFSSVTCKLFRYFNYSLCPISGWILVYISFERLLSIWSPYKNNQIKKTSFQIKTVFGIVVWNLVTYVPIIFYHDKQYSSADDLKGTCDFITDESRAFMGLYDLINSTLLPFFFMFMSSILIINAIVKSRLKVQVKNLTFDKIKRDIRFGVFTLVLNLMFILFNLPVCVIYVFSGYHDSLFALSALFILYANFAHNFYVFFIFNSFFRKECLIMLRIK